MRIGISIAQCDRLARPAAVVAAVRAAEQLGYSSVWVSDSLLDPAGVLGAAAAVTTRVRLGAVLRLEGRGDVGALARSLATIDALSEGRLSVAVEGVDDLIGAVLDAVHGLPVLLGGHSPAELDCVARRADGWAPAGVPVEKLAAMWATIQAQAAAHGRDPDRLQLVVRAGVVLEDRARDGGRPDYTGDVDQVAGDVDATRGAGAHEIVLRLIGDLSLDEALDGYARIAEAAELRLRAAQRV